MEVSVETLAIMAIDNNKALRNQGGTESIIKTS